MIYLCSFCKKESLNFICDKCGKDNSFIKKTKTHKNYLSNFSFEWEIHKKTQKLYIH